MAKVIPIGQPINDSERQAIGFLRDFLPEDWLIFHNFEMRHGKEVFEIDLAILSPHTFYLVDIKGTRGLIDVYGAKWYPEGRQPFHSPLAKLRQHAKIMASIIRESNQGLIELRKVHVHAAVLLTADDATLNDQAGLDGPDVITIKSCLKYFHDPTRIPNYCMDNISRFHSQISKVITGNAKPKKAALVFRDWQVEEKLGGTDHFTEYRAKHSLLGKTGGMARLRVYQADPYQEEEARQDEFKKISNAYRAVAHMPTHPNVLAVKDLFVSDDEDKVILVTEDIAGQALRQYLNKTSLSLTFDQKLQIMRDVLDALDHAHKHEVIHRNLTPDAVIVTKNGQARVTAFDYARVGKNRSANSTIAELIIEDLDLDYQAPECIGGIEGHSEPKNAGIVSDLFSAGVIFYELLTGEKPYETVDDHFSEFKLLPSELKPDLPKRFDEWLQKLCLPEEEERFPSAAVARKALDSLILPNSALEGGNPNAEVIPAPEDLTNLPQDFILANRFRVQRRLGSGGFSVAYKVFDSLGDVARVIKLVTKDRKSVYERLRREYKTLANLPEHPHVVKVCWADRMADAQQTPYIVFEYIDGLDVSDLIETGALSLDDAVQIVRQAAEGLEHLHRHGVFHQDIKPSNLLWTDQGVRIIDFNVAVSEKEDVQGGGGTRRYLPPDYDYSNEPSAEDRIDRDLYALGITFYQCLTGSYPFDELTPPIRTQPKDPKQFKGCAGLSSSLIEVIFKMIAPERKDRFVSATEFLKTFAGTKRFRSLITTNETTPSLEKTEKTSFEAETPDSNPFVKHLLTLYSQSKRSNSGTRGLDEVGKLTYVPTFLDEKLRPALFKGEFRLVIISGNAGDGKTAFIQQFESDAEKKGAHLQRGVNGAIFQIKGHIFQSNYDGSQDEGNERNDKVLEKFFAPFEGNDSSQWPTGQTRIIAINEGRLMDFFLEHEEKFSLLSRWIEQGMTGQDCGDGIVVINLNLRSVVAESGDGKLSIFERLILQMTQIQYWTTCEKCDIRGKCYIYHNIKTFQDPVAGPKVIERLKTIYTITHLRGRLHITMRDLRSVLAFMLVGERDCDEIHQIYQSGGEDNLNRILDGFYFNSWLGGKEGSKDRLLSLLREIDIAQVSNPDLDRKLGFLNPETKSLNWFSFGERPTYDEELLKILYQNLPRDYSAKNRERLISKHRSYLSHLRHRYFFECRDSSERKPWMEMLPYTSVTTFLNKLTKPLENEPLEISKIIKAINRGEGLSDPDRIGNQLALRVRWVNRGTIRSYRLFSGDRFTLKTDQNQDTLSFLEFLPQALLLQYDYNDDHKATLKINLDLYEMLMRLSNGYQPSVEELEGLYLSLTVFKNILSSAPYQEVLLTESGFEFFQIIRDNKGILHLDKVSGRA